MVDIQQMESDMMELAVESRVESVRGVGRWKVS